MFSIPDFAHRRRLLLLPLATWFLLLAAVPALCADRSPALASAEKLVTDQEKEGYEFRSESWENNLEAKIGRAVRLQLFKGNEYAFCIATPQGAGARISAAVLDFDGKPTGEVLPVREGWGLVLYFKPAKTGSYAIAIRQVDPKTSSAVPCAMIMGWK